MSITTKHIVIGSPLLALALLTGLPANAQSIRVCEQQASDAEGDGFGWEFDFENGRWDSCAVTSESAAAPEFTNRETGESVALIRAYWDPNTDIANRDIRCENYSFDNNLGIYEENPERSFAFNSPILGSYNLLHQPISSERPYLNTVTGYYDFFTGQPERYIPLWGVENGVYQGVAPMAQSPYVEIVGVNGGDNNAVRVWSESSIYNLCYDTSGDAFIPTGSPGVATANSVSAPEERVVKFPLPEDLDPAPVSPPPYTNLETGQEVVLTEPYWNYNADLALRRIMCLTYDWNEADNRYQHDPLNDFLKYDYVFHPRVGDSARVTSVYTDVTVSTYDEVVTIGDDGMLPFREGLGQVEIVDQAVRIWQSNSRYRQCTSVRLLGAADVNTFIWNFPNAYKANFYAGNDYPNDDRVGFAPTASAPDASNHGSCDYSNAALSSGWGWNETTRESCPPLENQTNAPVAAADCDYSNASENSGWGWNPTAGESCPPLAVAPTPDTVGNDSCDYTNAATNDGWGWNPETLQSCPPITTSENETPGTSDSCDYSNAATNAGWGWNPETRQSCPPLAINTPIETPVIDNCDYSNAAANGGWGWDSVTRQSCPPID